MFLARKPMFTVTLRASFQTFMVRARGIRKILNVIVKPSLEVRVMQLHIHKDIHTYIGTYIHTYINTCVNTRIGRYN